MGVLVTNKARQMMNKTSYRNFEVPQAGEASLQGRTALLETFRHASMHFNLDLPIPDPEWVYNSFTAEYSAMATFFMVIGTSYGYFGIQQVGASTANGKVIFSTWARTCKTDRVADCPEKSMPKVTACGPDVVCTTFGGEGVGGKSYKEIEWSVMKTYHFAQRKKLRPNGRIELSAYFLDPAVGSWQLISAMEVHRRTVLK